MTKVITSYYRLLFETAVLISASAAHHIIQWGSNALVICNHGPPTPGAGRGIAVEMSGVFTFALSPQCGGNTRDLCYIGKKGGAMKKT